jgi:hypothetical protein
VPGAALPLLVQVLEDKEHVTAVPPILKKVLLVPNSYRIDSVVSKLIVPKPNLNVVSALTVVEVKVPWILNNT